VSRERPFDQPIPLPDGLPIESKSTTKPATGLRRPRALLPWLLNAFSAQIETMRRLRSGGTQIIRIERIEVSDGGQAVIGNVKATSPIRDG
jgi:hypothetical protein